MAKHILLCVTFAVLISVVTSTYYSVADDADLPWYYSARFLPTDIKERDSKSLQKFVKPSERQLEKRPTRTEVPSRANDEPSSPTLISTDSHTGDYINASLHNSSSHQGNSSVPTLLLLKHFRKQPLSVLPQPTVISSEEVMGTGVPHPRLPARFVDTSALIRKSADEKPHANSSANHDILPHVSSNVQSISFPAKVDSNSPQETMKKETLLNGNGDSFRRKDGNNTTYHKLNFHSFGQPTITNSSKIYTSAYNDFRSTQRPHLPLRHSNTQKINVGTPGLTGLLVPDSQNSHLLKILELLRKRNKGGFLDFTPTTEPTNVVVTTYSPPDKRYQYFNSLKDVSSTVRPRHRTVSTVSPSPTFPGTNILRRIIPPLKELNPSPEKRKDYKVSMPHMSLGHPSRLFLEQSNPVWPNNHVHSNQRIYSTAIPGIGQPGLSLLPQVKQQPLEVSRIGLADTYVEGNETSGNPGAIKSRTSTERSTMDRLDLASLRTPLGTDESINTAAGTTATVTFGSDGGNLMHLVTASPVDKESLIIDMFQQVLRDDETKPNPLVKQLHNRFENQVESLQLNAAESPAFAFLFYFLVPFIIIAIVTFTLMGVAPQYVGLTGLLIPLVVMASLTNPGSRSGRRKRKRRIRESSSGESSNYNDITDLEMEDAHFDFLRHMEIFERSYLGG
ncbi:hypothetical protein SK128_026659 [Halocaridina rubra]|uniref:Uncharacterized protein n=1 Tax=Halocaridina rubra TaxID=373956 RepID=A0AAN8XHA5_HALRR